MKYIDAELLRKEVKRLERAAHVSALDCADSETRKFHEGKALAYQFVGMFIDSLQQEQPEVQNGKFVFPKYLYARTKDNKTIDMSYAPQDMAAVEYIRNDFVEPEQPVTDCNELKKHILEWTELMVGASFPEQDGDYISEQDYRNVIKQTARHFAEWGEKNAYKAIMKKADEVRDKRFDTDYEVKFEPSAGFDIGCVNVYHEGKLVGQYVEPKEEKKLPKGLEEAADKQAFIESPYSWESQPGTFGSTPLFLMSNIRSAFKAGAEWMAQQGEVLTTETVDELCYDCHNRLPELIEKTGLSADDRVELIVRKIKEDK